MGENFLDQQLLFPILASILAFIIAMSGCALFYLYLRAMRFTNAGKGGTTGDLTNIMILFQSMRETLDQQKELARTFNLSIDKKVHDIRTMLENAGTLSERVATAEKELKELVGNAKEDLGSVKRRLGYLQEQVPGFEADTSGDSPTMMKADQIEDTLDELSESIAVLNEEPASATVEPEPPVAKVQSQVEEEIIDHVIPSVMDAHGNVVPYDGSSSLPPLNAIASAPSLRPDMIDNWTGVDFGVSTQEEPVKIDVVDEPEDAETSRNAFRALLNMQSTPNANALAEEPETAAKELTPLQRSIYDFSDAGMKVSSIARELGIGKGEVKLTLNMRKKQA